MSLHRVSDIHTMDYERKMEYNPNNWKSLDQTSGQQYDQQYDQPSGQQYDQKYDQKYDQPSGQQHDQPSGQQYGQQYDQSSGQQYGQQYDQPSVQQYDQASGQQYGQQQHGQQYGQQHDGQQYGYDQADDQQLGQPYCQPYSSVNPIAVTTQSDTRILVQPNQSVPNNYMSLSILSCFFCCWPLGLVAIGFSHQSSEDARHGKYDSARSKGRIALGLSFACLVAGVTIVAVVLWYNCSYIWYKTNQNTVDYMNTGFNNEPNGNYYNNLGISKYDPSA